MNSLTWLSNLPTNSIYVIKDTVKKRVLLTHSRSVRWNLLRLIDKIEYGYKGWYKEDLNNSVMELLPPEYDAYYVGKVGKALEDEGYEVEYLTKPLKVRVTIQVNDDIKACVYVQYHNRSKILCGVFDKMVDAEEHRDKILALDPIRPLISP